MKKIVVSFMRGIVLAYLPVILILPVILEDPTATIKIPYILTLLILFLYSFPFFAVYLEIYSLTAFFLEKKEISGFQKGLKTVGAVLLLGTVISVFFINKTPAVCFTFAGILFVFVIIDFVSNTKSGERFALLKDGRAWLFALTVAAIVFGVFLGMNKAEHNKVRPEPVAPTVCIQQYR